MKHYLILFFFEKYLLFFNIKNDDFLRENFFNEKI